MPTNIRGYFSAEQMAAAELVDGGLLSHGLPVLGIAGVHTEVGSWACKADPERGVRGSQIDLLIMRADNVINLCEMKYSRREYVLTSKDEESLRHKIGDFQTLTKSRSAIHVTLVTTYGLTPNAHAGSVQSIVCAEDLFA